MAAEEELQTGSDDLESLETGADLAPATGEDLEETTDGAEGDTAKAGETGEDPKGFTKAINKKHYELMEERRKNVAAEQENERLRGLIPQEQRPDIPVMPDPYDDDFTERMAIRDKAIQDAATFDGKQTAYHEQQTYLANQAAQDRQQVVAQKEQSFVDRAKTAGISDSGLDTALKTVSAYGGVGKELSGFIMDNEQGPAIAAHLAQHPEEIMALQSMTPMQGAAHLVSVIQPKLAATNTGSDTPTPPDSLSGGGGPPGKRGPKGATYS